MPAGGVEGGQALSMGVGYCVEREKTEMYVYAAYKCVCPSSLVWVRLSNKTNGCSWNLQVEAANSTNRAHTSVWPTIVTRGLYTVYWWFLVKSAWLKGSRISGVLSNSSREMKCPFSISCLGQQHWLCCRIEAYIIPSLGKFAICKLV